MAWGAFPAYLESRPRERIIGVWDCKPSSMIVTEDGELRSAATWEELVTSMAMGEIGMDLHIEAMKRFPYMKEAIFDKRATVGCNQEGELGGVEVRIGRRRMWIGSLQSWGMKVATMGAAVLIRQLCDYMGEGTRQSPAAVGQASMRRLVAKPAHGWRRKVPCWQLRQMLQTGGVGARNDTWAGEGEYFPVAYEIDMDDAYLWGIQHIPDGVPLLIRHGESLVEEDHCRLSDLGRSMGTWFGQAVVWIPDTGLTSKVSPLPFKDKGRITQPVKPGWYGHEPDHPVFLFKEDVEDCLEAGMLVWLKGPQWAWTEMSSCMKPWAEHMVEKRANVSSDLEGLCKLSIVAAIGWHGQKPQRRKVVPLKDALETDSEMICTVGEGADPTLYSVEVTRWESMPYMTHWYWHDQMNVRRWLRRITMEREALGDVLISTNTDSVIFATRMKMTLALVPLHARLPGHGRAWEDGPRLKIGRLTNVTIPYPRAVVAAEKVRLPGTVRLP